MDSSKQFLKAVQYSLFNVLEQSQNQQDDKAQMELFRGHIIGLTPILE